MEPLGVPRQGVAVAVLPPTVKVIDEHGLFELTVKEADPVQPLLFFAVMV
jgi:hypothetical protein